MTRHKPSFYADKEERIVEMTMGSKILHLGCIGNTDEATDRKIELASRTLHMRMTKFAASVLGIDLDEKAVSGLLGAGVFDNIQYGDACHLDCMRLGKDWDFVVVGDLIEHVSNPGLLLDSICGVMGPSTRLVITTPNAFGLPAMVRHARNRFVEGHEHVMSFNYLNVQQLLERHGLATEEIGTCYQTLAKASRGFLIGRMIFECLPRLGGTLFVVARLAD